MVEEKEKEGGMGGERGERMQSKMSKDLMRRTQGDKRIEEREKERQCHLHSVRISQDHSDSPPPSPSLSLNESRGRNIWEIRRDLFLLLVTGMNTNHEIIAILVYTEDKSIYNDIHAVNLVCKFLYQVSGYS